MSVVDTHPQRQQIIEGILAGKSCRELSRQITPTIHHGTIAVYRKTILLASAKGLKRNQFGANVLLDTILQPEDDKSDIAPAQRLIDSLRAETEGVIRSKLSRQNRWIDMAEGKAVRDANGDVVMVDGKPLLEPDHRALAAHDRNQTSDLDLLAKVRQLYQEAAEGGQGQTAVMSFGDVNVYIGAPAQQASQAQAAPQVIDVEAVTESEPLDVGIVRAGNKR